MSAERPVERDETHPRQDCDVPQDAPANAWLASHVARGPCGTAARHISLSRSRLSEHDEAYATGSKTCTISANVGGERQRDRGERQWSSCNGREHSNGRARFRIAVSDATAPADTRLQIERASRTYRQRWSRRRAARDPEVRPSRNSLGQPGSRSASRRQEQFDPAAHGSRARKHVAKFQQQIGVALANVEVNQTCTETHLWVARRRRT